MTEVTVLSGVEHRGPLVLAVPGQLAGPYAGPGAPPEARDVHAELSLEIACDRAVTAGERLVIEHDHVSTTASWVGDDRALRAY